MKRTLASLAALLIATAAAAQTPAPIFDPLHPEISGKSSGDKVPYAYTNRFGVGPNNDSR